MRSKPPDMIIVVGAARSGTTMVKEALSAHTDAWSPEYELNHVWRYGSAWLGHDMLTPEIHLNPRNTSWIRQKFNRLPTGNGHRAIVEKTVANVMRLKYINALFPNARVIHVLRDGRAVVASAIKRWQNRTNTGYLLKKGATIPFRDTLPVALNQLKSRLLAKKRKKNYIQSWGPRWPGIDEDVAQRPLVDVCALQWRHCVDSALSQRTCIPEDRYLEVHYETLVRNPLGAFSELATFAGLDPENCAYRQHVRHAIHAGSVEKWRSELTQDQQASIRPIIGPLLRSLGYENGSGAKGVEQ